MSQLDRTKLDQIVSLVSLSVVIFCIACSKPSPESLDNRADAHELIPVLRPDLTQADANVRQQIEEKHAALEILLKRSSAGEELVQAFGELGLIYIAYAFPDAAERCFKNAETLAPNQYQWPYLQGYIYQIQGRLEEGVSSLEKALALRPDDQPALIRSGTLQLEQGDYDRAQEFFQMAIESNPTSAAALDGLGKAAVGKKDYSSGTDFFEEALKLQPNASSLHHALGLAYRNLGERDLAMKHLDQGGDGAVLFVDPLLAPTTDLSRSAEIYLVRANQAFSEKRYESAARLYRQALEYDPKVFTTYKAMGFSLEKLGDFDGAAEQLKTALHTATTGDETRDTLERAEIYRILGGLTALRGRPAEAIKYFRKAIDLNPRNFDARSKLANILARNLEFDKSIEQYTQILRELPDHSETLVRRASAYVNMGQVPQALADFEHATMADPQNSEIRRLYAEALKFVGEPGRARQQAQIAQSLTTAEGDRTGLLAAEAKRQLRRGDIDAAISGLEQALKIDPSLTDARYDLATAYGHVGRLEDAIRELRQILKEAPLHGPAWRAEITALLLQQNYAEARVRLNQGLKAMPRDHGLAQAYTRILATSPDARVRDGRLAVDMANRIFADQQDPITIETLALAYAESGEFEKARQILSDLRSEFANSVRSAGLMNLDREIEMFESGQPWRASSPDEIIQAAFGRR